ncbi:hypothetical protein HYE68_000948 [Fusarium pseudograminearum]|nr:hypothetical protein HYE68_000948 [Fusarium pseudograminearum]
MWAKRMDLDKDNCTTGETPLKAEDGIDALALNNTLGVTQQKATLWESAFRRASPFTHARPYQEASVFSLTWGFPGPNH